MKLYCPKCHAECDANVQSGQRYCAACDQWYPKRDFIREKSAAFRFGNLFWIVILIAVLAVTFMQIIPPLWGAIFAVMTILGGLISSLNLNRSPR